MLKQTLVGGDAVIYARHNYLHALIRMKVGSSVFSALV